MPLDTEILVTTKQLFLELAQSMIISSPLDGVTKVIVHVMELFNPDLSYFMHRF